MDEKKHKLEEWSSRSKWNPFNSYKLLAQLYRWRKIQRGQAIPQPALITVDPVNACNLSCIWCNADNVLQHRHGMLSRKVLLDIARFLPTWKASQDWEAGVEAVCIAGGGEPLISPDFGEFVEALVANDVEVGVVTNGTLIDRFIEPLAKCTWVGVSVDAGGAETFRKIKGRDDFDKVIENMRQLVTYAKEHNTRLASGNSGYGVSYKYLLHPDNIGEITDAVRLARDIGCKNFHSRPMGIPWDKLHGGDTQVFTAEMPAELEEQVTKAREYETDNFRVFSITHKFDSELNRANYFSTCHAIFMTFVIGPSTDGDNDHFTMSLCCDRRGDARLELGANLQSMDEIKRLWGSDKHWEIFDNIDLKDCPRCTYQPHNQIFENVIEDDSMTYKFI